MNMVINNKAKITISLTGAVAFFLAIAPILDPYVLFTIGSGFTLKINDILMLFLGVFCFSKYFGNNYKTNYLFILLTGLLVISIIANIYNGTSFGLSIKNILVWFIYASVLIYIWKTPCRDKFFHWVEVIATIAAVITLLQFVAGYLDIPMWDGRLPFFELGKYDGWAGYIDKNTGDVRPNGIFQEASYVGIYISIAYVQALKHGKFNKIIIYALAMLSTTSMVAVVTCAIITIYTLMAKKNINISSKIRRRIIIIVTIAAIGIAFLISTNESVAESFAYILKRISNFESDLNGDRMSSTKYRLLGHIDLFFRYTPIQKIFGVGVAQYSSYFDVTSYSNVWVTTILNSGIVGLLFVVLIFAVMYRKITPSNRIFFLIMIMIFSSDYQWFSWYFFYLISACILKSEEQCNSESMVKRGGSFYSENDIHCNSSIQCRKIFTSVRR